MAECFLVKDMEMMRESLVIDSVEVDSWWVDTPPEWVRELRGRFVIREEIARAARPQPPLGPDDFLVRRHDGVRG